MWINLDESCACSHHLLLNLIKEGANAKAKSLLQKLEDPCDAIKISKTTLLHYAVLHNNVIMIQPLIEHGYNVNAQDTSGDIPLILAILKSNVTAVDILLKNNADVYASNSSGENSLQMASLKCYHLAPLIQSVEFNIFKKVLAKANNVFMKDKNTTTQLVLNANDNVKLAVVASANVELAKVVLKGGYSLNYREPRRGFTALHVAIYFQKIENILLLIKHGADVDAKDHCQYSAIHCYMHGCELADKNSKVLKSLLSRTKGLHLPNETIWTDLEYFLMLGNKKTVKATLQSTMQSGIDVTAIKFEGGKSFLQVLIENRQNADVYHVLDELDIQYDVNAADTFGYTALTSALRLALRSDRVEPVEFLLKRGADVNLSNRDTPHLLCISLHFNTVIPEEQKNLPKIPALLLEYGADAQYVFSIGKSLVRQLSYQRGEKIMNACNKMIIAHLALLKTIEDSSLTDLTRNDIKSAPFFKDYFIFCTKQLKEMENVEVHGNVTLLKLLTNDQEKITAYARNQEFISAFDSLMKRNSHLELYYSIILNRRVAKAIEASRFEEKLSCIIENLTGSVKILISEFENKMSSYY